MRAVFAVALIALVASSSAIDLTSLGTGLIDSFKETGLAVAQGLAEQAKNIISNVLPSLLQNLLGGLGKRELILSDFKNVAGRISNLLDQAKQHGSNLFSAAVNRLKGILEKFHITMGTSSDLKALEDEVDQVIDQHNVMQKRFIGDLLEQGKALLSGVVDTVKNAASNLLSGAKDTLSQLASAGLQKGAELLAKTGLLGKRAVLSLSDHLTNIGNALTPILDPFKDMLGDLGTTLKGHFSNIVDTVSGHVNTLKDKLSGHISDLAGHGSKLLEHGTNALSALGDVASDILQQTLENGKEHINGIGDTLNSAANVIGNHINGN